MSRPTLVAYLKRSAPNDPRAQPDHKPQEDSLLDSVAFPGPDRSLGVGSLYRGPSPIGFVLVKTSGRGLSGGFCSGADLWMTPQQSVLFGRRETAPRGPSVLFCPNSTTLGCALVLRFIL